ncbi:MAG: molybdopterin-guanine dinucleotide biosynthesis protein B [Halodesulfurarchaeum sp.]
MKVVSVAGNRDAGKTSLIEALLQAAPEETAVATVKSIHHEVEFDTPGTDTHRHRSAGADVVIGLTPSQTAEFRTEGKADGVSLTDKLEVLAGQEVDWVFVEGFKSSSIPTILVGDIDESAVAGDVLLRVPDGTAVDGAAVLSRLGPVPEWVPDSP